VHVCACAHTQECRALDLFCAVSGETRKYVTACLYTRVVGKSVFRGI
jgi:hypothetical protein